MKSIVLFVSAVVGLGLTALPARAQPPIPGPAYLRSNLGQPWGSPANEAAMDRVFGAGQWRDLRFETVEVTALLAESTFLFLEGSDQGAQSLENFLTAHLPEIESWVGGGGVLFVNAAPNSGDGMNFGFGVTLNYSDSTSSARAANTAHPIFQGPFVPVGTFWTGGAFGHATVSGDNLIPLIANDSNGHLVLAEKGFGRGWVLFGGMTTDNHHQPQPETQNLRANILAHGNAQADNPTNQPPEILLQPVSQAILAGQAVTFRATARGSRPLTLQWLFDGQPLPGATNANLILSDVTTHQAGGYKLVASNALGVATSQRATLTVSLQGPRITLQPSSLAVRADEDATFSVLATGGPLLYQWRFNGVDLPGATNATLFLPNVLVSDAGTYQVAISNLLGYVTSAPATLTVIQFAPRIAQQPFDVTASAGDSVQFFVGAEGAPLPVYQWRFNDVGLPGQTNAGLFLSNVATNQAGRYSVVVSNFVGSVTSQTAVLTVNQFPPSITFQPLGQTVSAGSDVFFSVGVSGTPPMTFQWRFNGAILAGATNQTLFLPAVHPNRAGVYSVVISNRLGFAVSSPAILTVVGGAAAVITAQPADLTLLAGASGTLSVGASGQPAPTYQWFFNGAALPGATASSFGLFNVATNQAGNYTVVVSNLFRAVTSRVAVVTVNLQAPTISVPPASRNVIAGTTVIFGVIATGGPPPSYQWLFNNAILPGATGPSLVLSNVFTNQAGLYSVIVSNAVGFVISAPATLTVNGSAPVITTQPVSRTVLDGSNVTFSVVATGVPAPAYQWRFNGVAMPDRTVSTLSLTNVGTNFAGEYTVAVSNLLAVVLSQPATLTVTQQTPAILSQSTNRTAFAGANVILQVQAVGGPRPTYQWQRDGIELFRATNTFLILSNVSRADQGTYAVVVSNPLGSVTSQPIVVTVLYQPPAITGQPTNRTVLGGGAASFTVTATGSQPLSYQWHFNGAALADATNRTLALDFVTTNQAGGYSVVVTNYGGAATSSVATLTVLVQPTVILVQPADRTVRFGGSVNFFVSAAGTPPLSYQWDYNGTDLPGATNDTLTLRDVTFENQGSYRVTITGGGGTAVSRKAGLTVNEPTAGDFSITALLPSNARLVEHNTVTGDDRGGIATSSARVFYTGDAQTGGFALADLANAIQVGRQLELIGDLNSEKVYALGNGANPVLQAGVVTTLIEVDGMTGQVTPNIITLSQPISLGGDSGLFAGYDQVAFYNGGRVYSVEMPLGLVVDHGPFTMPFHAGCESFAFWGVAETIDGELHLAFVRDSQTISRVRVRDGLVETIATFASLSDMCSFTLSLSLNRWYFHHEGGSQFGGFDEGIGFADATWQVVSFGPPSIRRHPQSVAAPAGYSAQFSVLAGGLHPLSYQWRLDGADLAGATNRTLLLAGVGASDAGNYSVIVGNALGSVTSQVATLTVQIVAPSILAQPFGRTAFEGTHVTFSVIATGAPPPSYQWQFNGTDLAGATNSILSLPQVTTNDAGSYRVLVSNPAGMVASDNALLTVRSGTNVITTLLIWDELSSNTLALRGALEAAGILVELSDTSETGYDGTNPGLEGFNAVIHLNGTTYATQMPVAGQNALVQFVRDGGGYLESEWSAYEISEGRMQAMRDLVLFDRAGGNDGLNTWEIVPEQANHPVLANLPSSFSFLSAVNFGSAHPFATEPVTVLMRDPAGHDAVAVREFESGRIVGFEHSGNYNPTFGTLADPNIQQLYIDGVLWAAGGAAANVPPTISIPPTDRTVAVGRTAIFRVGARGTRPLSYQWYRVDGVAGQQGGKGAGENSPLLPLTLSPLLSATNATLTISNAALADAGQYSVVVSNAFGSVTSAPAVLTISEIATVGVFDDPAFVDSRGGSDAESDALQASLRFLGYSVATFTNIATEAAANLVLVFPELEVDDLAANLDPVTQLALKDLVATGGALILHGVPNEPHRAAGLLNLVFDFALSASSETDGTLFTRTAQADLTAFADNAVTLPANHGSSSLNVDSLPPDSRSIYEAGDVPDRSLVAVMPYGLGRIIFLGWDWNNASPLGAADNGWLDVLNSAMAEAGGPAPGTNRPPVIAVPPQSRFALNGGAVTLHVLAGGSPPLTYQWQFNGADLPGATNAVLMLTNLSLFQSGSYVVIVSNPIGVTNSPPALLTVADAPANAGFRITRLTANGSRVAEHGFLTGHDRGGIAVSDSHVFYTGDDSTARFVLEDLSGGASLGLQYDAMVSNLRTEKVYSLGDGLTPIFGGGGTVTTLIEINGATGELTTNTINLSTPIGLGPDAGIFAGYDQVVLLTQGRAYSIHLPSGIVVDLGEMLIPDHYGCENWAFWGVAENFDDAVHIVYVRDGQTISRTRVPDGATEDVASFDYLSDMCSFTMSLSLNRWYFHHEGASQFGGISETIGYADAAWEFPVPPVPPSITQPPQNVNGLWGGAALFQVVAEGPLLGYQWLFEGAPLPGGSAATLLLANLTGDDAGHYTVVVRNPFGSVTSAPVTLTVSTLAPAITVPPVSQTVVLGVDVLFLAEISGAPAPALQWFFNNAVVPGATNASLLLTNVTLNSAGSYRIVADNFVGSAISPVATLTVLPQVALPVALDTPGQDWTTGGDAPWVGQPFTTHDGVDAAQSGFVFDDETSWLQTTVTGPGTIRFSWKVSSEADYDFVQFSIGGVEQARISGEVNWQARSFNLSPGPQTLRWTYAKDGSVREGADRAWLDEVRLEIPPRIVTHPASRTVVEGGSVTFGVAAEGSGPLFYQWRFSPAGPQACRPAGELVGETASTLTLSNVRPCDAGQYSVVVSNAYGRVTSSNASLTVTMNAPLVVGISAGGNTAERSALSGSLTNLGFAVRFINHGEWAGLDVVLSYPGGGLGPSPSEISGGVSYIQISDHGSGWTPNSFFQVLEGTRITIRVDAVHPITEGLDASWTTLGFWRYGVVEEYVGWSTDLALPSLASETVVANRSRVLVANTLGSGRAVYIGWNVYGPDAGNNDIGLLRNAIFWAAGESVVPTPPAIARQPDSQTVAAESSVTFAVVARGTTPLFYQWQFNGAAIPGATNDSLTLGRVLPADAGQYSVLVSNVVGTVTSAPATLSVTVQAPVIVAQPASQAVLGGGSVALSVVAVGVPAPTYQWKKDGVDVPGATNSTLVLNHVTAADAGNYKVIVRNLAGVATSLPARLTVNIVGPQITLQPASQAVLRGTNAIFSVVATGAPAPAYQWRFNGTDLAGETNAHLIVHQSSAANVGSYTVRVSNSGGTMTSASALLTIVEFISLPDALDMAGPLWQSGGGMPWFGQPMISHDGVDAASSGGLGDSQESWLETTVTGPGTVSFWWKVSSEPGFDELRFSLGQTVQAAISGETDWQPRSFSLPTGQQTLRWTYAKDGSDRLGADAGWVDQVVLVTTTPALVVHASIVGADVRIQFATAPGRRYRVERADGLAAPVTWQPVAGAENILGTGLPAEALDVGGAGAGQRFYRVALLP